MEKGFCIILHYIGITACNFGNNWTSGCYMVHFWWCISVRAVSEIVPYPISMSQTLVRIYELGWYVKMLSAGCTPGPAIYRYSMREPTKCLIKRRILITHVP